MADIRRIHIIGGTGSGKTHAARRISEMLGIQAYDLDDIFWDNTDKRYNQRVRPEIREQRLKEILLKDSWIIEGVYFEWLKESFERADVIIVLMPHPAICALRVLWRFIRRKIGILPAKKKETVKGLIELLKWNQRYHKEYIPEIIMLLESYKDKRKIFAKADKAVKYIKEASWAETTGL